MGKRRNCGMFACGPLFWDNFTELIVSKSFSVAAAFIWQKSLLETFIAIDTGGVELIKLPSPDPTVISLRDSAARLGYNMLTSLILLVGCSLLALFAEARVRYSLKRLNDVATESEQAKHSMEHIDGPSDDEDDDIVSMTSEELLPDTAQMIHLKARRRVVRLVAWQTMAVALTIVPAFSWPGVIDEVFVLANRTFTRVTGSALVQPVRFLIAVLLSLGVLLFSVLVALGPVTLEEVAHRDKDSTTEKKSVLSWLKCFLRNSFCSHFLSNVAVTMSVGVGYTFSKLSNVMLVDILHIPWLSFIYAPIVTIAAPFLYWRFLDSEIITEAGQPYSQTVKSAFLFTFKLLIGVGLGSVVGWAWRDCWKYWRDMWNPSNIAMMITRNLVFAIGLTAIASIMSIILSAWQRVMILRAKEAEDRNDTAIPFVEEEESSNRSMMRSTGRVTDLLSLSISVSVGWAWTEVFYSIFLATVGVYTPLGFKWFPLIELWLYTLLSTEVIVIVGALLLATATYAKGGSSLTNELLGKQAEGKSIDELESAQKLTKIGSNFMAKGQTTGIISQLSHRGVVIAAAGDIETLQSPSE